MTAALIPALMIALPASADLVGMQQLQSGVSGKPASGVFCSGSVLRDTVDIFPLTQHRPLALFGKMKAPALPGREQEQNRIVLDCLEGIPGR